MFKSMTQFVSNMKEYLYEVREKKEKKLLKENAK